LKKHVLIFLFFAACASAFGYTRITVTTGETPRWPSMPVSYWINEKGLSSIQNGSEFAAILESFHTWERVGSANIEFSYRGLTSIATAGRDGFNVVSFADTTAPLGSSTIAATFSFFRRETGSDGVSRLLIDESDIVFSPSLEFSTSAETGKYDIQSVLTHEIGHLLGLDHSALISSVMVPFGAPSQLDQRTLAYDDIAGVTEIYPNPAALAGAGQIRGTIRAGGTGIPGAHVVAVNSEGTPLVSTLSQPDGSYLLRFLPPGAYRVFAEPLDQPVTKDNIGGGFYTAARTDFGTTYFGEVSTLTEAPGVTVNAGGTATADIATLPKSATGLNLTRPAFGGRLTRGRSYLITVGGEDLTAGAIFSSSNNGLILGSPTFGGRLSSVASTSASMSLTVSSSTPLGPKNIAVNRGADASIVSGALVINDPGPLDIAVAPANGPTDGGTAVTITGSNFRSGAQVYFGGLAAGGINVVNSGTILANAPKGPPNTVNVVVVNADGTWGSAVRAFTYDALNPVINNITPADGPPLTSVVIEGANFDSRAQNVAVQFNGTSAPVVNSTSTAITALVPFDATTGPITVTVFGKSTTGPVFSVTASPNSTNVAKGEFNFIDAGVTAGGTSLSFSNGDDAVTSIPLPFNFSLFRDIYAAGAPVSVTTNGFISLQALAFAEYQNGPLPGQSAGGTAVTPASLIAPFWDDLVMKSDSSITTRTVGNAPNRQFVVQWTNMSIYDEAGTDLNASLTFELVLFEGSNDIQFLYRTMNGPNSDGSSATIGAQDSQRTTAIQSGFNQPVVSSGTFITYHFANGAYSTAAADVTPPVKPVITDEGVLTANRTQLAASWTSEDPESGITEFQYAIGTTPGGTDVKPFTSTTQNSAVVTGLNLQAGATYYFAVKAVNGVGLVSDIGVSDGIRYDAAYQPQIRIIASAPESSREFTGLALLAPTAMNVVLRAYDANGAWILGSGVRNPATISMAAGQQYARLLPEFFGIQNFDGWIEIETSAPGLGIFAATGGWDMSTLDGIVARDTSTDFVLFHSGATATFVNPSIRTANVTMTSLSGGGAQTFAIPPRARLIRTLTSAVRVQSSEALAAIERTQGPAKLALNAAVPVSEAQSSPVFPHAVAGGGYTSTLILANVGSAAQTVNIGFSGGSTSVQLGPNASARIPLTGGSGTTIGAVTVSGSSATIVGVLDIENETGLVTIVTRPSATDFAFPHVANGNGLFTGLALATGNNAATITIDVYPSSGVAPKSSTINLAANQQLARVISELVSSVGVQMGGYIRVHSDQPIWALEIYGSDDVMAAAPPI
jgi:hypothetical protein